MTAARRLYRTTNHQHKGDAYLEALRVRGWRESHYHASRVSFGIFDADWRPADIDPLVSAGIPYFLYPHAARPMVQYDGTVTPRTDCRAMFTMAPGGVELMQIIGYPCPVYAAGWSLTPVQPFHPREQVKRILFAPIHPNANGFLHDVDKNINRRAYAAALKYCKMTGAEMTVRYLRSIEGNGLGAEMARADAGVTWYQGEPSGTYADTLSADVVISHQTYAYMAVALGVPCVMMGEDVPPRSGNTAESYAYVTHWSEYRDLLMFPLDILNGDPEKVIARAISTDEDIRDWKARYIGAPFDPEYFVNQLEALL